MDEKNQDSRNPEELEPLQPLEDIFFSLDEVPAVPEQPEEPEGKEEFLEPTVTDATMDLTDFAIPGALAPEELDSEEEATALAAAQEPFPEAPFPEAPFPEAPFPEAPFPEAPAVPAGEAFDPAAFAAGAIPIPANGEDYYGIPESQLPEGFYESPEAQIPVDFCESPEAGMPEYVEEPEPQPIQEDPIEMKKKKKRPVKKGRPRRKKGDGFLGIPHLLATVLWLAIIVAIGVSLGKLLWVGAADVLAFGRDSRDVTVTIVAADDIDSIATKLGDAGLVRYPELFKFYARLTGADEKITTGTFELNTILDYHALTSALSPSSSSRAVVKVTIPEGYSCRQTFNLLAASNVCSVEALEEYAATGELGDYWFLEGVERGNKYCLEGFLFPDTYEFYENSTPREALARMLNGFENRYSQELIDQIDVLNGHLTELMTANGKDESYIASHLFTVREVIIVASLIEEETAGSLESATIASVIYNRLFNWGDYPAYLNIDASIIYALDGDTSAFTTSLDSPYNTYTHTGLTPTPISNPGLTSIQAALNPESTLYYYYVLNPETGLHQFSKTQEEQDEWIEKFYPNED